MRSKPKKILFLITKSNWGGAQRYVYDLATGCKANYEIVVVHGGTGPLQQKLHDAGVRTIPLQSLQRDISLRQEIRAIREIWNVIKSETPDVMHINSSKAGLYGSLLGRLCRVPRIIFTAHGWAFNEPRSRLAKLLFRVLHWLTVWFAHTTIAVSQTLKLQLQIPVGAKKITVIPLAITPPNYFPRDQARKQIAPALSEIQDAVWLGTIAELHPVKNHRTVIKALQDLLRTHPHIYYVIVGDGELRRELESLAHEHNVTQHVIFTGHIPDAAVHMKAFDIFALPSLSEAAGYVLHEAAHARIPIVASEVGGIPELITNRASGMLVEPTNIKAWEKAISKMLDEPKTCRGYAGTLYEKVTSSSLDKMIRQTQTVYNNSIIK